MRAKLIFIVKKKGIEENKAGAGFMEFIREGSLPSVTCYIGHRSTLLARALYESDNLLIWKFKGRYNHQRHIFVPSGTCSS